MEHSPGLEDTKSLRSWSGNRAKMLLEGHLGIKCHSQYKVIRLLQYSSVQHCFSTGQLHNQRIQTFYSIYNYFALLKAFNTNTLNFHQYFKDKLSSHQPSHMHNTGHRTNINFNAPLFNHSKSQKFYLYQVIPIWNSLPSLLKNYTSKFTYKKQIKRHLLASQS